MATPIESLAVGVVGGVVGGFGAKWTYRVFSRPRLHCKRKGSRIFVDTDSGLVIEHRVNIKNIGNTPAKNCKIELELLGHIENREKKTYKIDITSFWTEPDNPTRLNINPGEVADAVIYRYTIEDMTPTIHFPTEGGWLDDQRNIFVYSYDNGEVDDLEFKEKIVLPRFQEIEWECFNLKITANKAKEVSSRLKIVDEVDSMGVQGKRILVDQKWPAPPRYP